MTEDDLYQQRHALPEKYDVLSHITNSDLARYLEWYAPEWWARHDRKGCAGLQERIVKVAELVESGCPMPKSGGIRHGVPQAYWNVVRDDLYVAVRRDPYGVVVDGFGIELNGDPLQEVGLAFCVFGPDRPYQVRFPVYSGPECDREWADMVPLTEFQHHEMVHYVEFRPFTVDQYRNAVMWYTRNYGLSTIAQELGITQDELCNLLDTQRPQMAMDAYYAEIDK